MLRAMNTNSLRALLARLKDSKAAVVAVLALVALVTGGTLAVVVDTDGPDGPSPAHTVRILTATVDSADVGRAPDKTVTVPAPVVAQAKPGEASENLRAETPSSANLQAQEKAAENDQLPVVQPDAAPSQRGCTSSFVVNYSTRRGVAPREIVLHETVSRNVFGWADVNAIVALFNRASSAASSNYVLDREGHCAYIVRESDKAWTQAAGNPWSISFEIINTATHADKNLIDGAGRKRLISTIVDISKRWDIPLRRGSVAGCVPRRAGIIDHTSWGACGGGHVDVNPFRSAIDPIIVDARALCQRRYRAAGHKIPARCKA